MTCKILPTYQRVGDKLGKNVLGRPEVGKLILYRKAKKECPPRMPLSGRTAEGHMFLLSMRRQ